MKGISSPTSIVNVLFNSNPSVDMMSEFDVQPLGRVIFGSGTLSRLGSLCQQLGGRRVLLVTDPGLEKVGHPRRAQQSIEDEGLEVHVFDGVKENPTEREVNSGVMFARQHQIDFIVAVGGGSSMDCAKGINFLLTNGGRMIDYKGHGRAKLPMLPSIGVPTTAGTGSEAQSYALITDESTHMKMACGDKKAAFRVSILDPDLTASQPKMIAAVTGIDALAHAIESYVCTKANPFSRMCSLTAWRHLNAHFVTAIQSPENTAARSAMLVGAHFAGMAIENAMLGACHSCSNPLTAHYGITHGVAIGIMLPHVIRYNSASSNALYADLVPESHNVTPTDASEFLAQRVMHSVSTAGMPTRLREAGVAQSILPLLADEANQQWTARFNPRPVNEVELLKIYQAAW